MKKQILLLVMIIAVVGVFSGCGNKQEASNQAANTEADQIQELDTEQDDSVNLPIWPEQKFTEDDYVGWKTYHNKILGYEIKHPADWTVEDCDEGCESKGAIINPPDAEKFTSYVSIGLDGRSLEGIRSVYLNPTYYEGEPYKEDKIIFNHLEAYLYHGGHYINAENLIIFKNSTSYSISIDNRNKDVFKVISSFKFID